MKRSFIILFLLLNALVYGQTPDNNWAFGLNAQINFDGGAPNDAGSGPVDADESSGSISDSDGNLLFTTNGIEVYDRNGNIMPNGTGLKGHWSSSQNVVIVPFPGDIERRFYYIFTVGAEVGLWSNSGDGLEYVIVDMEENGGLGDVIQESTELISNTAEKIHATYHTNNQDVWVVVHEMDSDAFYSILITCEGIQEPVASNTGSVYVLDANGVGTIGYLKISHNGPYIASTFNTMQPTGEYEANHLEIGTFNHSTGEIIITESIEKPSTGSGVQGYGLEFSPDNSKLYWTRLGFGGGIFQFDLNTEPVATSEVLVSNSAPQVAGMVLAPDGNIYLTHSGFQTFLSRLSNPNEIGTAVNMEIGVNISNPSKLGLPNNWMYPYPVPELIAEIETYNLDMCIGESVILSSDIDNADTYIWSTGATTPTIIVNDAGTYELTAFLACDTYTRTFEVTLIPEPDYTLSENPSICEGESVALSVDTENDVLWYNDETSHQISVEHGGRFELTISNNGCSVSDEFIVTETKKPQYGWPADAEKCETATIYLLPEANTSYDYYLDGVSTSLPIAFENSGFHTLTAENECGTNSQHIEIKTVDCSCEMYVPNAFTPDGDGLNDLLKPILECPTTHYNFEIFDRWGALVFHTTEVQNGWDGSRTGDGYYLPPGVYAYRLQWEANKLGEKSFDLESGHITLIR